MKKLIFLIFIVSNVEASGIGWVPYFEPVPLGAKSASLGYSDISNGDEMTAFYFNPAGLSQVTERVISCNLVYYGTERDWLEEMGYSGAYEQHLLLSNFLILFPLNKNLHMGIGYFLPDYLNFTISDILSPVDLGENSSYARVDVITTAVGLNIFSNLNVGGSVNFSREKNYNNIFSKYNPFEDSSYDEIEGTGIGTTIGINFKPNSKLSLGAFYRSPDFIKWTGELGNQDSAKKIRGQDKIPQVIGVGGKIKCNKNITLYGTYMKNAWSEFERTEENNLISGSLDGKGNDYLYYNTGIELLIKNVPLRLGISYIPEHEDFAWDYTRIISVGTAYPFKSFVVDIAVQYDFRPSRGLESNYKRFNLVSSISYKK